MILVAPGEELERLGTLLKENGVPVSLIYEDVSPYVDKLCAIGIAPVTDGVQRWLRHLKLLR